MESLAHTGRVVYKTCSSDQFYTPLWLRERFWARFGMPSWDPATADHNPMRAARWTTERGKEALTEALCGKFQPGDLRLVWLNPPYGRGIGGWLAAVSALSFAHPAMEALVLVPVRTGSAWYEGATDKYSELAAQAVCELSGRLTFETITGEPHEDCARWGNALLYWGPERKRFVRWARGLGSTRPVRPSRPVPTRDDRQLRLL